MHREDRQNTTLESRECLCYRGRSCVRERLVCADTSEGARLEATDGKI